MSIFYNNEIVHMLKNYRENQGFLSFRCFILIALLFVLGGCASNNVKHYVRPNADVNAVKRVAVLPIESLTPDQYAGEKVRRVVISELLSKGIDVIEPGEVTNSLRTLNKPLGSLNSEDIKKLGEKLAVDAVIMGSVEAYKISSGLTVSYPEVSVNLRLVDTASGTILWSAVNTSGGAGFWTRHFGAESISLSETARRVIKKAVDTLPLAGKTDS